MCPLQTVLDDSIGCAIWFAARGLGKKFVLNSDNQLQLEDEQYKSKVKVRKVFYLCVYSCGSGTIKGLKIGESLTYPESFLIKFSKGLRGETVPLNECPTIQGST